MRNLVRLLVLSAVFPAAFSAAPALAQQEPDTSFDTRIARPAFTRRHPRVAIDEAHHNFHTMTGRYAPFAALLRSDGFEVGPGRERFSDAGLRGVDVLVISNALGHEDMGDKAASNPAFTDAEVTTVRRWVEQGGSLLLIADHSPMGAAARGLGMAFGVDMRNSYAIDTVQAANHNSPSNIAYVPGRGLDAAHPIMRGRDSTETVRRVVTFTGQSLAGPPGASALLRLSDRAEDLMVGLGEAGPDVPAEKRKPAGGRAQGLAFELGKGRVVVMAEAAMMSAQVAGRNRAPMGMNAPGNDDRQFVINAMRWLARVL
ncbi:MAG: DUF4350 domain-containing protein [Candidatus Eisenbacteria bacterium]